LPLPRRRDSVSAFDSNASAAADPDVQLLPCVRPNGSLESAPRTSLRADSPQERWEGFWCVSDERYYTRCVRDDGSEQWFRLVDEAPGDDANGVRARVIRFPSSSSTRGVLFTNMRLVARDGRKPILVGTARRRSSARTSGAGGGR
jgi:hypothetical protein